MNTPEPLDLEADIAAVPELDTTAFIAFLDEKEVENFVAEVKGTAQARPPTVVEPSDEVLLNTSKQLTVKRKLATADAYEQIVKKYGDPLEELARIAFHKKKKTDPDTGEMEEVYVNDAPIRVNALKELVAYGHSKLKTVEHTGAGGETLQFKMSLIQNILNVAAGADPKEQIVTDAK